MKVLVIDDDIVSRLALVDVVQQFGLFDIIEVDDGAYGLSLMLEGLRPALCCCDVRMPNLTGLQLLHEIKAVPELTNMPFVLVSAAADEETMQAAATAGADGYLLKPIDGENAQNVLGKVLNPLRERMAEHPASTLKRLQLTPERLLTYFSAFQRQLDSAEADIDGFIGDSDNQRAHQRVQALHTGCLTLGLWQAASLIDGVEGQSAEALQQIVRRIHRAVDQQASQFYALLPNAI